jgi:hypothetical protein
MPRVYPGLSPLQRRLRPLLPGLAIVLVVLIGRAEGFAAQTEPAMQVTEPPIATEPPPPTQAPPTQEPPTQAPPTQAPPTEAPPTEIPPTEAPSTEVPPTEGPTETPDPFPATPGAPPPNPPSRPTQLPVDMVETGEAVIDCSAAAGLATPSADTGGWSLSRCSVTLPFSDIDSIDIQARSSDPGWRIVLLDPARVRTPGLLEASNNRAVIDDPSAESVEFVLGARQTCSALGSTSLTFDFTGTRDGANGEITATGTIALESPDPSPVTLDLTEASLDTSESPVSGTFSITWERASSGACPWHIVLVLPGAQEILVNGISGPAGMGAVATEGAVIITVPADVASDALELELEFPVGPPTSAGLEAQVRP